MNKKYCMLSLLLHKFDNNIVNVIMEANYVDPNQTAPTGSILFVKEACKTFQQTTKVEDFCCDWRLKG